MKKREIIVAAVLLMVCIAIVGIIVYRNRVDYSGDGNWISET